MPHLDCLRTVWRRALVGGVLALLILIGYDRIGNVRTGFAGNVQPEHLTVMSYNIRVGYGSKDPDLDPYTLAMRPKNLPPIVAAIQSIDPDIIGLQEVHGAAQAQQLATALHMHVAYEGHGTGGSRPSWWGVALLSKYPILKTAGLQISAGRGNTKSALLCTVAIRHRAVIFVSLHKDKDIHDNSPLQRLMKALQKTTEPVVLLGDFNMRPLNRKFRLLQERFIDTATAVDTKNAQEARRTGTFVGIGRIDYVFVDAQHFAVQDAGILAREHWEASDHLAYYARIAFKGP